MKKIYSAFAVLAIFVAFLTIAGCGGGGSGCSGENCGNNPPVVQDVFVFIASPGNIETGKLNGFDEDGNALTFKLSTLPSKLTINPFDANTGDFSATADKAGVFQVSYIANDGKADSEPATLTVVVFEPDKFILVWDGYLWFKEAFYLFSNFENRNGWDSFGLQHFVKIPTGCDFYHFGGYLDAASTQILPMWEPEFADWAVIDANGNYELAFQVECGTGKVLSGITRPECPVPSDIVANAGADQTVTDQNDDGKENINLSSKSTGIITSYNWYEGADLLATGADVSVSLTVGIHTILMKACDTQTCVGDEVVVTVKTKDVSPEAPTANAGPDQTVEIPAGQTTVEVTLDGSGSTDPDGNIVSYVWSKVTGDVGSGVSAKVIVGIGVTTFQLKVMDSQGLTDIDGVAITATQGQPVLEPIRYWFEGNILRVSRPMVFAGPIANCGNDRAADWNFDGADHATTSLDLFWMVKGTSLAGGQYLPSGDVADSYDLISTTDIIEYDANRNRHLVVSRLENGSFVLGRQWIMRYDLYPRPNCGN